MGKKSLKMANKLSSVIAVLRHGIPKTMKSFSALATAAQNDSRLDAKTKELIATEIAAGAAPSTARYTTNDTTEKKTSRL